AMPEVTIPELSDILAPNSGKLWQFYNGPLKEALMCQNGQCQPTGSTPLNPAFVNFISQLMKFSKAVYGDTGTEPNYKYSITPRPSDIIDTFTFNINGDSARLRGGQSHGYVWNGGPGSNFQLQLGFKAGGSQGEVRAGTWGVFRYFAN